MKTFPVGAKVRVSDICTKPGGAPGLLPINPSTWFRWVKAGRVPQGQLIGPKTRVWPVEVVLAIGESAQQDSNLQPPA